MQLISTICCLTSAIITQFCCLCVILNLNHSMAEQDFNVCTLHFVKINLCGNIFDQTLSITQLYATLMYMEIDPDCVGSEIQYLIN